MTKEDLKLKYQDEKVLCVKDIDLIAWSAVYGNDKVMALHDSIEFHGFFAPRYEAELNEDWKQVIPYVVVKNNEGKYFVTKRIGGDARLTGSYSLGLGGHVNPCDMVEAEEARLIMISNLTLDNCMFRELKEETTADIKKFTFKLKDVFIDESEAVSRVHVCQLVEATYKGEFKIKETEKLEGQWMTASEIAEIYDKLEGWSKIAYDMLKGKDKPTKRTTRKTKKDEVE